MSFDIANEIARIMRATHDPIVNRTFIEGMTPHQYITKQVEQLIREARIDELQNMFPGLEDDMTYFSVSIDRYRERIEELKAED